MALAAGYSAEIKSVFGVANGTQQEISAAVAQFEQQILEAGVLALDEPQ